MSEHDGCEHSFGEHLMVATGASPAEGGILICHVRGCLCYSTWDAPQLGSTRETIRIPGDEELARLREQLQGEWRD